MYTESGEKEASKRRRTKRRGTTEDREFQDRGTERAEGNFGGARRENGGDQVKKKKRYA